MRLLGRDGPAATGRRTPQSGAHPAGNRELPALPRGEGAVRNHHVLPKTVIDTDRPLESLRRAGAQRICLNQRFVVLHVPCLYNLDSPAPLSRSVGHNYDNQTISCIFLLISSLAVAQAPEKSATASRAIVSARARADPRLRASSSTRTPTRRSVFSTKASTSVRPIPTTSATSASTRRVAETWARNSSPSGLIRRPTRATSRAIRSI